MELRQRDGTTQRKQERDDAAAEEAVRVSKRRLWPQQRRLRNVRQPQSRTPRIAARTHERPEIHKHLGEFSASSAPREAVREDLEILWRSLTEVPDENAANIRINGKQRGIRGEREHRPRRVLPHAGQREQRLQRERYATVVFDNNHLSRTVQRPRAAVIS